MVPESTTILVVDDDPFARRAASRFLRGHGYHVLNAETAADALALVAERAGQLDLLLTDCMLPGTSGIEFAVALHERYPEVRILVTSGYPADSVGEIPAGASFIEKPFSGSELAEAVKRLLG